MHIGTNFFIMQRKVDDNIATLNKRLFVASKELFA